MTETVDHPTHYNVGAIEVIDAIEAWRLGFNCGNVVKYVARAGHKGALLDDLKKARWYLDREIRSLEPNAQPESSVALAISNGGLLAGSTSNRVVSLLVQEMAVDRAVNQKSPATYGFTTLHSTEIADRLGVKIKSKQYRALCSVLSKLVARRLIVRVRRGLYRAPDTKRSHTVDAVEFMKS